MTASSQTWLPPDSRAVWSVYATVTLESGRKTPILDINSEQVLKTASLGKLFILLALSELLETSHESARVLLQRPGTVNGSGVWARLDTREITVEDAARLVAVCSDNVAANSLIDFLSLDRVQDAAQRYCSVSMLNDYFRSTRESNHPHTVSHGSSRDYSDLSRTIQESKSNVLSRVRSWLEMSVDSSLVFSSLDIDPLSHSSSRVDSWFNKTGSDEGVKADTGSITFRDITLSYAAISNWPSEDLSSEAAVYQGMRSLSTFLAEILYSFSVKRTAIFLQ